MESEWADVLSGVPQGSVLGPSLFICYINDLAEVIHTNVKILANDTKVFTDTSALTSALELQHKIDRLQEWATKWQLSLSHAHRHRKS